MSTRFLSDNTAGSTQPVSTKIEIDVHTHDGKLD